MGGGKGGKSQTVGYKHYVGMHMVPCHGPIDAISRLTVDNRVAWTGWATGGSIVVNAPNLFGGDKREGGVSGTINVEMGEATQTKNDYLLARIGSNIPAYRGVVGLVFRQCYMGNNPYLKPWRMRGQRIFVRQDGIEQWYPEKAGIPIWGLPADPASTVPIDFVGMKTLDLVGDSTFAPPPYSTFPVTITLDGLTGGLASDPVAGDYLLIGQSVFGGAGAGGIGGEGFDGFTTDYLNHYVPGYIGSLGESTIWVGGKVLDPDDIAAGEVKVERGSTNGGAAVSLHVRVYRGTLGTMDVPLEAIVEPDATPNCPNILPITEGSMAVFFGCTSSTNTPGPFSNPGDLDDFLTLASGTIGDVITGSGHKLWDGMGDINPAQWNPTGAPEWNASQAVSLVLRPGATSFNGDINPAHLIRECLTDPDWGMAYSEDDVDDASFTAAADTLFDEGLGMSLLWDKQATLESFISDVVRHIDAALYVSRSTGKFVLKLTRFDYDPDDLLLLDESNIDKIEAPTRPQFGELINAVNIQFWNSGTGKDDSIALQDPAGVQMQGAVISTTIRYDGFTSVVNANIVGARDLRALSNPFLTCTVYTSEAQAAELDIGDTFKLKWDKWQLAPTVMRVTGFAMSDGKTSQVRIQCVEDVFSTPLNAVVVPPGDGWVDPSAPPEPAAIEAAFEIPYYELAQRLGQTATDTLLTDNPDLGYVGAAAMRGNDSTINASLWTDSGGGYIDVGAMDVCAGGFLQSGIGQTETIISLEDFEDLDIINLGSHGQLGTGPEAELFRVDFVNPLAGTITIGRGVLDTVPSEWAPGTQVLFWDDYAGFDSTEYVSGEEVDAKVTPISGSGEVPLASALPMTVEMAARAFRPYPPGNLTVNGDSYLPDAFYEDDLMIEWVDRDRLLQTSGLLADHFDGGIGPEAGTLYRVQGFDEDGNEFFVEDDIAGTSFLWLPTVEGFITVAVSSKRDGVYSTQAAHYSFYWSGSAARMTERGDYRVTERGDIRVTEV